MGERKISAMSCDEFNFFNMRIESLSALKIINERFLRLVRMTLSNRLRKVVSIELTKATTDSYTTFMETYSNPSFFGLLNFQNLGSGNSALISIDNTLAYSLVDSLLGGLGKKWSPDKEKEPTQFEVRLLLNMFILPAMIDYGEAWRPYVEVDAKLKRMEINPVFLNLVTSESKVFTTYLNVLGDGISGQFSITIPLKVLFPVRNELF